MYCDANGGEAPDFAIGMDYCQETLNVDGPDRDKIKSQIQEDFAKADIYFQSLNVQTIVQERKYTVIEGQMSTN